MKKILFCLWACFFIAIYSYAQLKFVAEDFEGFADGTSSLKTNGIFTFGNIQASIISTDANKTYFGKRAVALSKKGKETFGGWGIGIGRNIELDETKDYLNFFITVSDTCTLKIELQEDDNENNLFEKEKDDSWVFDQKIENSSWQLISIPLNKFHDGNMGGDGIFNASYKNGKLFTVIFSFQSSDYSNIQPSYKFDFISFSQGKLNDHPQASANDFCSLGVWSKEGNSANFAEIPIEFERTFGSEKKIGVAHFFQPFAFDGGSHQNLYPSIERINKVIDEGYIPLITLEDHFVNAKPTTQQPNLYSIVEGHFDKFFNDWAKQIKKVKGVVLLRILHEFNGDWYPWCISKNNNRPELLVNAFRHIRNIFYKQDAQNVKFIWCPNSMSVPQEKWNYILDAYPGSEWVDFVGLDIYNGAGESTLWRSFRKEGIESYFLLTQNFIDKPLLLCEVASRERKPNEAGQSKAQWIEQMAEALQTDMTASRMLCWFNEDKPVGGEKKTFRINSSADAKSAFLKHVVENHYFKAGAEDLKYMLGGKFEVKEK